MSLADGAVAREFHDTGQLFVTFETAEGNFEVKDDQQVWTDGAEDLNFAFVTPIKEDNLLVMDSNFKVKNRTNETLILGRAWKNAGPKSGSALAVPNKVGVHAGVTRHVTVQVDGKFILEVDYDGSDPALEGSVKLSTSNPHKWEAVAQNGESYVVELDTGNKKARVLFMYGGNHG